FPQLYAAYLVLRSFPTRRSSDLKVILSALEATLRLYLEPENLPKSLPTLSALSKTTAELQPQAQQLLQALQTKLGDRFDLMIERSEEHTSELQSRFDLVCRLLLE